MKTNLKEVQAKFANKYKERPKPLYIKQREPKEESDIELGLPPWLVTIILALVWALLLYITFSH